MYLGIRKDSVNISGRLCLADQEVPFGNPSADSDRTKITTGTIHALVVPFLPPAMIDDAVKDLIEDTAETLRQYVTS